MTQRAFLMAERIQKEICSRIHQNLPTDSHLKIIGSGQGGILRESGRIKGSCFVRSSSKLPKQFLPWFVILFIFLNLAIFFFIFVSSRAKIIYEKDNTQGLCQSASQRTISQIFAYCKNKIHRSGKNQVRQLNSFCMHGIPSFKEYLSPIL